MQRAFKRTRAKRGRFAKYNTWRANNREIDNARRRARAAERKAEKLARLNALAEAVNALPPPPKPAPPLRMRVRIEVTWPGNREAHSFTASWCPVFLRWSVPQRRIVQGMTKLMQRVPVIAGLAPEDK